MTLRGWLGLAIGAVLAAWLTVGLLQGWQAHQDVSSRVRFMTIWMPATMQAGRLNLLQVQATAALDNAVLNGQADQPQPLPGLVDRMAQSSSRLSGLLADDGLLRSLLAGAQASQRTWLTQTMRPVVTALADGRPEVARAIMASGPSIRRTEAMHQATALLNAQLQLRALATSRRSEIAAAELSQAVVIAMAVLLTTIIAVAVGIRYRVLLPFRRFGRALRTAANDPGSSPPIPAGGPADIAEVGRDAEGMRLRLLDQMLDARSARQSLGTHAPLVAQMRHRLHGQAPPQLSEMDIFTATRPAVGVIGGDWSQFVRRSDDKWCLVLGDVSGHGWEAGLVALQVRAVLESALRSDLPLDSVPDAANRLLSGGEHTIAMVLVELDTTENHLRYVNAGHPPPLLVTRDGSIGTGPRVQALAHTGPLLSCLPGSSWCSHWIAWQPGDLLIGFSDGLWVHGASVWTAATDWSEEMLLEFAGEPGLDAQGLGERLIAESRSRSLRELDVPNDSKAAPDDVSLIVIARRRLGAEADPDAGHSG